MSSPAIALSSDASAMLLHTRYAMSGTNLGYAPTSIPQRFDFPSIRILTGTCLRACYAMPGTDLLYAATSRALPVFHIPYRSGICLRACYAVPGTDLVCNATPEHRIAPLTFMDCGLSVLRRWPRLVCAYAHATRCPVLTYRTVVSACTRATRCPVLTVRMCFGQPPNRVDTVLVFCGMRLRVSYALSGTDVGHRSILALLSAYVRYSGYGYGPPR
eukprot:2316755-Rhodomonas_salina.4